MIVQKNRHLEAAIAILGSKSRAKSMLRTLENRIPGSFQFLCPEHGPRDYAILLLHNEGETATCLVSPPERPTEVLPISELVQLGMAELQERKTKLAQTIMAVDDRLLAQTFEQAGFHSLAVLTYMERISKNYGPVSSSPEITFESMDHLPDEVLQRVLQETYVDSLDCPKIHGIRSIQDIIKGHRAQGEYEPSLWTIAMRNHKPVGVLLLSPAPSAQCMELIYLGSTSDARGQGIGDAFMRLAVEQSATYGLSRIVLAVDVNNSHAIELYSRWNFHSTHQRQTMIRKLY